MAKFNDNLKVSNEEIEAKVEEFTQKIETLRVRYEQYFVGTEKKAPVQLRMDVARLMRDLEHANIRNTALKFKVNTCIQKFTSYSTYWNRVLREIEDGTYKRHLDRAKRMTSSDAKSANTQTLKQQAENAPRTKATQEIADEAEAFLASLGLDSPRPPEPSSSRTEPTLNIVRPAFIKTNASAAQSLASQKDTQPNPALRYHSVNPTSQKATQPNPAIRQPAINPTSQKATQPNPAIRQSAVNPATQKATQPNPAIRQPSINPVAQRPQHAPTITPSAFNPAVQRPQHAPTINPSAVNPAVQRPQHAPTINPSAVNPAVQRPQHAPTINSAAPPAAQRPQPAQVNRQPVIPAAQRPQSTTAGNQPTGQSTQRSPAGRPLPPLPRPPYQH